MILPGPSSVGLVVCGAVLGWLELRRADRRRRLPRLAALLTAVAALGWLGVPPETRGGGNPAGRETEEAVVWTGGKPFVGSDNLLAVLARVPACGRFALPGVEPPAGAGAAEIPDLGYLRRHFPKLRTVHLVGDGLAASELAALEGCAATFQPSSGGPTDPAIGFLTCARELPLGASLVVQGRVDGLAPGTSAIVSLEGPDAVTTETTTAPAGAAKAAIFEVKAPPIAAAGRFVWRVRLAAPGEAGRVFAEETLGVSVVDPPLPRVLVLESSPHPDTAALRRWFARLGGSLTAHTRVGADHFQFASTGDSPKEFTAIDDGLLGRFDLVLGDPAALAALTVAERAAITRNVTSAGLGVLVVGAPPISNSPQPKDDLTNIFSPWKLGALDFSGQGEDAAAPRLVRPQAPSQAAVSDLQIPAEAAEILPAVGAELDPLLTDGQGHLLAARVPRGRGQAALTLIRDTWRWSLENDPAAFALYWSLLLTKVARPETETPPGRWSLADGGSGPVFVDEPLTLAWTGEAAVSKPAVVVSERAPEPGTSLALAEDVRETHCWTGTFWPREPGWHRVTLPATGASVDFYVSGRGTWEHLQGGRRRGATERFVAQSTGRMRPSDASREEDQRGGASIPAGWVFALFLTAAGFLWAERYWRAKAPHSLASAA